MSGFLQFIGLAVMAALLALTLRASHSALGMAFSLAAGVALLLLLAGKMGEALDALRALAALSDMGEGNLGLILKLLGVSFACEFAAQACRDAGEEGIALRVELGGKVMLLLVSAPLLTRLAGTILALAP